MTMFTLDEIFKILYGKKTLTIRRKPMKENKIYIIKKDRTSKRYGFIKVVECSCKKLWEMTNDEAFAGGYNCRADYISDQLLSFNKGITEDDDMYFIKFELSTEEEYNKQK